jgi:hypothetical protein
MEADSFDVLAYVASLVFIVCMVGFVIVSSILHARCPKCKTLFAMKLVGEEKIPGRGGRFPPGILNRTYRCRRCGHERKLTRVYDEDGC